MHEIIAQHKLEGEFRCGSSKTLCGPNGVFQGPPDYSFVSPALSHNVTCCGWCACVYCIVEVCQSWLLWLCLVTHLGRAWSGLLCPLVRPCMPIDQALSANWSGLLCRLVSQSANLLLHAVWCYHSLMHDGHCRNCCWHLMHLHLFLSLLLLLLLS